MKPALSWLSVVVGPCLCAAGAPPPCEVAGEWAVRVGPGERVPQPVVVRVAPAVAVTVRDQAMDRLPLFAPKASGWQRGARLPGVTTQETSARGLLVPDSVRVKAARGDGALLQRGVDYELDAEWGCLGRLDGGKLTAQSVVWVDYQHGLGRIDTLVLDARGQVALKAGEPHIAVPRPPALAADETPLANLWVPGRLAALTAANLLPITETAYPEAPPAKPSVAERVLPKTLAKLRAGERLRLLAWGDSVTQAGFLGKPEHRWQDQFVARLQARFPQARIELVHLGWGGRNTGSFLAERPGSPFNYREKVLGAKPDLIVSEFVNDAGLNPAAVEARYGKLLVDFQEIGAEWAILTPHYVRPDWMGLRSERDCDDDPRPYVAGLRAFADKHPVALADAARRWGRLWRQGIPYTTLLLNAINHPDERGMKLFADALMVLFPER